MFNYGHERRAFIISAEGVDGLINNGGKKNIYRVSDRKTHSSHIAPYIVWIPS